MQETNGKKLALLHILTLAFGIACLIGGCFQNSLWFDEAYTVGLVQQPFGELLRISTYDVHPPLYYLLLKLFASVFGYSIPVLRLFSVLGAALLTCLGWTHIRSDFGPKIGFWFSFFALFCGETMAYALQIRMYTWLPLFVTLCAIYAYRSEQATAKKRDRILYIVFSLCACYTHWFGLFACMVIHLLLLYRTVKAKQSVKRWLQNGVLLVCLLIPALLLLLRQKSLKGATWIRIEWPDILFDFASHPLTGNELRSLVKRGDPPFLNTLYIAAGMASLLLAAIVLFLMRRACRNGMQEKERTAFRYATAVFFGTIGVSLFLSLIQVVYYIRYTMALCGFLFFLLALTVSAFRKKKGKVIFACLLLLAFGVQAGMRYAILYDPSGNAVQETLDTRLQSEDTFLIDDYNAFVVTVRYQQTPVYYVDRKGWNVRGAYQAFSPKTVVTDSFDELPELGTRVWTVGWGYCYQYLLEHGYTEADRQTVQQRYYGYTFELLLMVK